MRARVEKGDVLGWTKSWDAVCDREIMAEIGTDKRVYGRAEEKNRGF